MTIRTATSHDISTLANLITQLGYLTSVEQMARRFAAISNHGDYRTVLANDGSQPVGMIAMTRSLSWEYDGCFIRITALVVSQTARQRGVGQLLIDAAEQWAAEIGATRLVLTCGNRPERVAAHQFYPKMGFMATSTGYSKQIGLTSRNE